MCVCVTSSAPSPLLWVPSSCWRSSGRRTWCSGPSSPPTTTGTCGWVRVAVSPRGQCPCPHREGAHSQCPFLNPIPGAQSRCPFPIPILVPIPYPSAQSHSPCPFPVPIPNAHSWCPFPISVPIPSTSAHSRCPFPIPVPIPSPSCALRDHARGNEELAQLFPGLQVFGADERIGALTHRVTHGQELMVSACSSVGMFGSLGTSGAQTLHTGPACWGGVLGWAPGGWHCGHQWGVKWGGHTVPSDPQ